MSQVESQVELMDTELKAVEAIAQRINARQRTWVNLEDFRKEIIERFAQGMPDPSDRGNTPIIRRFAVDVKVYTSNAGEDVYAFDIEILDRIGGEFDPERQVHDVTADILDLGTKGKIPTGPILKEALYRHKH